VLVTLALRNLVLRPWRSLLLLAGFGLGVGVMITLLSIGEAMVIQARDEKLVGGGDVTVLPDGVDLEVLKTGGVGGLWFSVANARFVFLQLLAAPRLAPLVQAAAPQMEGKLLYLRSSRVGEEIAVRGSGEVPSLSRAVGNAPTIVAGAWEDDDGDRRWASPNAPSPEQLYHELDRFHLPPVQDSTWAEWHYFNVAAGPEEWWYVTYLVGGAIPTGRWGGQLLVTHRLPGGRYERYQASVPGDSIRLDTTRADLRLGGNSVTQRDGRYTLQGRAGALRFALTITPHRNRYFPPVSLREGEYLSGYVVPALSASAEGEFCVAGRCTPLSGAPAYHDHNWGVWREVTWDWGAARAGAFTLLYGRVLRSGADDVREPLFVYLVDSLGFRALFRPPEIRYTDGRTAAAGAGRLAVPSQAVLEEVRGEDTLRIVLTVEDAVASDVRLDRRGPAAARRARPWFIQMKGRARLEGRLGGRPLAGEGTGFFETYR